MVAVFSLLTSDLCIRLQLHCEYLTLEGSKTLPAGRIVKMTFSQTGGEYRTGITDIQTCSSMQIYILCLYMNSRCIFVLICLYFHYCCECVHTFWWGMTGMGESILGVAVGTGAGRLDLKIKAMKHPF